MAKRTLITERLSEAEKQSPGFTEAVAAIARRLGMQPSHLLASMDVESSFNPSAVNPSSSATGLIQFMPSILKDMGYTGTVKDVANLSRMEQLPLVEQYFRMKMRHKPDYFGKGFPTREHVSKAIFGFGSTDGETTAATRNALVDQRIKKLQEDGMKDEDLGTFVEALRSDVFLKPVSKGRYKTREGIEYTPNMSDEDFDKPAHQRVMDRVLARFQDIPTSVNDKGIDDKDYEEDARRMTYSLLHDGEEMPEGWRVEDEGEVDEGRLSEARKLVEEMGGSFIGSKAYFGNDSGFLGSKMFSRPSTEEDTPAWLLRYR